MMSAYFVNLLNFAATSAAKMAGVPGESIADEAEHHVDKGVFPPFDPTYFPTQVFWLLISFGLLYFILSRVLLPTIGETLEERSSRIADDLDAASRMQREAEEAKRAHERALADARAKAHNVAEATRQSVDKEIEAEMAEAEAEADKAAEIAEARIRKIRSEAMANIDDIAADITKAAVKKVTGKAPTRAKVAAALKG